MSSRIPNDVYSPREIARAAGVSIGEVRAALGGRDGFVPHDDAVRLGRELIGRRHTPFGIFQNDRHRPAAAGVPLAVSTTLHAGALAAVVFVATLSFGPTAAAVRADDERPADMRLVFLASPGPGGGGGGGGRLQKAPPPKAQREGQRPVSSPMPVRRQPERIEPIATPPEPKPAPISAEPLPVVVAPIITAPADTRDRVGILQEARTEQDSHGPGQGGGVGTGRGTGIGEGDGSGVGPGSGGGTGGGPYRPGSGIQAPRLLHEVKADYTEDARRRGLSGEVILEIVVRRDGSVGDVKVLQGLGGGLNERAVGAVRQWRFAPATRLGTPVDVLVEVAVEFKLR
jgi:TonB family protein